LTKKKTRREKKSHEGKDDLISN